MSGLLASLAIVLAFIGLSAVAGVAVIVVWAAACIAVRATGRARRG